MAKLKSACVCSSGVLKPAMRSAHAEACPHDANCRIGAFQDVFLPGRTF